MQKSISGPSLYTAAIPYIIDKVTMHDNAERGVVIKVSDIMSKEVVVVKPDDTLASLVRKFIRHNCHTFPVVEKKNNRKLLAGPLATRVALSTSGEITA